MTTVELVLQRIWSDNEATQGYFLETSPEKNKIGFTIEDQKQTGAKVKGETRIPAGRYKVVINKAVTELTKKYRLQESTRSYFQFHIMLENVPGFSGIYIHIGNTDDHSEGCLLIADVAKNIDVYKDNVTKQEESGNCYKRFYLHYYPIIDSGTPVYITIKDEQY
jgi:hypothetical protein